ncbi:zf-HC2 domain-containing protein [Pedobacter sp. Hv1]|uniref:zf-HC2 domain-containing protein n=1 Tax=Pedobacter sp. Hv1 TaxID=1740090 RepID=UPI0006D8B1C1|nr:zf-HC2 domain-containing protein [Pedobacter sp. Hv1]KQC00720.1 hypothetical protein AQF98_08555 [Pedobacter sp. Hv1]
MNPITKIAYNCQKATFLIEKKQLSPLTAREKMELKIHLAGCSVCRMFQQQSIFINKMFSGKLFGNRYEHIKLDEDFKSALQQKIEQKLEEH